MAQIIRHRKGVLESVSGATKRKAELLIVTGSSGITSTNSDAMVFFGDGTDATPANKIIYGTSTPDLTGASYSTAVDGIPFYNTSENKLYILAKSGNIEVTQNLGGTGIFSSSLQVANALTTDNRNIDLGSGTFTTTGLTSLGVISGSSLDLTGNANIQGNLVLGGNITIGDASSDTISFGGDVASDIIPTTNNTYDLGSSTKKFAEVHATSLFGAINATNGVVSGSVQVLGGTGILSSSNETFAQFSSSVASDFAGLSTSYLDLTNIPQGIVSGSSQVVSILDSLNSYTASNDTAQTNQNNRLTSLEAETGSIASEQTAQNLRLSALETETGSIDSAQTEQDRRLSALETETGSIDAAQTGQDFRISSLESFTSSIDSTIKTKLDAETVISGSSQVVLSSTDGFTAYSSSVDSRTTALEDAVGAGSNIDGRLTSLESFSGSQETKNDTLETYTASVDNSLTEIHAYTSSLKTAITVDNQDVTIAGNLTVSGTTTTVDSQTINIGDNIIELNGSGAALGGLYVGDVTSPGLSSGSLLWDGSNNYWIAGASGSESKVLLAGGDGVVSGSAQVYSMLDTLNAYTASNDTDQTEQDRRLSALETETGSIDTAQTEQDRRLSSLETETGSIDSAQTEQDRRLLAIEAETGSIDAAQTGQDFRLSSLESETGSIDTAQTIQDSRLSSLETKTGSLDSTNTAQNLRLTQLEAETGSIATEQTAQNLRLSALEAETGSITTEQAGQDFRLDSIESYTASLDSTYEEKASGTHTLVSGSEQLTSATAQGEILMQSTSSDAFAGSNLFSDTDSLISIGTATGNVGDLASGNQLSLYGSSISGLLSFDISGTAKAFDYVASNVRYLDTNTGVSVAIKPDATAGKAWVFDTDGDLVSAGGAGNAGALWVGRVVANSEISASALLVTGNAKIDGNLTLGGNIQIGDQVSDTVTFTADLASDIIPSTNNTYDLGSATDKYAEIHGVNIYGAINATNGVISGSSQLDGQTFGASAATSFSGSFSGSFFGDGSGITGLSTELAISGSDGSADAVALLDGALSFAGGTGVSATVATDTVTISVQDGSTSQKGIASFDSDDFTVTSGNVALKAGDGSSTSGGVRGANLNADVAGTGLTYSLSNQDLNVDYGSTSGTAVQGNTTLTVAGTTNEIEITSGSVTLGAGGTVTIGLPDDVTVGNDLTVTNDLAVSGNATITGNLSVLGTTTTIDSTTVQIGDNIVELNVGGAQTTAGLLVTDATAPNTDSGSLLWDGTNDYWKGGALGSEKEFARLNSSPTSGTILKANGDGLLVDSVLSDDGTDATFSGDVIVSGLSVGSNGGFLYVDTANTLQSATATNAGDVIQWNGSSFVASNELDGGTF